MFTLIYAPHFVRSFKKLPQTLQHEVNDKLQLFCDPKNHQLLRLHKLKGSMRGLMAFSVNYSTRIVVCIQKGVCEVYVLDVGDHSIYN